MVRWFRHYPGLARDGKLVAAALRAKQPIERVVWTWCAILEDAAERMDGGAFRIDTLEAAHFLGCAPADLEAILNALEAGERTERGVICAWETRQFRGDTSTARVQAHRALKGYNGAVRNVSRNGDETKRNVSRNADETKRNGPESESESESDDDGPARYAARAREGARAKKDETR